STRFRFAERVWYLDKKPSLCTGCEVGCNVTMEHRRGDIKRYKPRFNPEVNDYWMCDYGRSTFERYKTTPRLTAPRLRAAGSNGNGHGVTFTSWQSALLGSGFLTCEEAYLFAKLADGMGAAQRPVPVDLGPEWTIPRHQRPPIQ